MALVTDSNRPPPLWQPPPPPVQPLLGPPLKSLLMHPCPPAPWTSTFVVPPPPCTGPYLIASGLVTLILMLHSTTCCNLHRCSMILDTHVVKVGAHDEVLFLVGSALHPRTTGRGLLAGMQDPPPSDMLGPLPGRLHRCPPGVLGFVQGTRSWGQLRFSVWCRNFPHENFWCSLGHSQLFVHPQWRR